MNPGRTLLAVVWMCALACHVEGGRPDVASLLQDNMAPRDQVNTTGALVDQLHKMSAGKQVLWAAAILGDIGAGMYDYTMRGCSLLAGLWYYVAGLVVMVGLENRTWDEAMGVLGQQISTVGYGSHTPAQDNYWAKIWHAAHITTSVLSPDELGEWPLHAVAYLLHKLMPSSNETRLRSTILLMALALGFGVFALDVLLAKDYYTNNVGLKLLDALYQSFVTLSSVGYGDISPMSKWGRAISLVVLPVLTSSWSQWVDWLLYGSIKDIEYLTPYNGPVCRLVKQLKADGKALPDDLNAAAESVTA